MTARSWFWVLAVVYVVTTLASWAALPDRVPVHIGAGGEPDRVAADLDVMGSMTLGLLLGILFLVVSVADDTEPSLGAGFWWLLGGYLLAVTGYLVVMLRSYRQVPP